MCPFLLFIAANPPDEEQQFPGSSTFLLPALPGGHLSCLGAAGPNLQLA